ncbi:ZIP zinc transporter-domain-containing protein [Schizothecium vesticola]|uniref:ZIP zinc transporter-domain-containing protein n=1 Tax=Schizothecium vesticola TaxID=314040 RepID=A0AA40EU95_9PEZI|nr:ZIP zinc transporter-domain-containing protein [Schizothecium vesticola]
MSWLPPTARRPILFGLLAAPLLDIASAALSQPAILQRAPQVTPAPTVAAPASITAVSNCSLDGTVQYCQAGTVEVRVSGTVTASSYTGCHAHGSDTYCNAPGGGEVKVVLAAATPAGAAVTQQPSPEGSPTSSLTAISECHLHGASIHCMAGATEYVVHMAATGTTDVPPAFTGCHAHDSETYCVSPKGEDVAVSLAATEEHGEDHDDQKSGQNCHFHAGVEHCDGEAEEAKSCDKTQRDYNIKLRVGLLFVMLVTSCLGVFTPILISSFVSPSNAVFTILRQFGTGVIISTAFIHLFTHAVLMFGNECLGELEYEATAAAILMAGIFLSFLVEYLGIRLVQWHAAKKAPAHAHAHGEHSHYAPSTEMVNITVLEAGVIFHSLLIGLTLVVAGDSFFITLFVVIVFHQMFEGIALGTRIASLGFPANSSGHNHGPGHHGHFHGPKQPSPSTFAEELVAASDHPAHADPKAANADESDMNSPTPQNTNTAVAVGTKPSRPVSTFPMRRKMMLAAAFALVTPLGMAIGIGVLQNFNGNDPSTIIAIGTLDALSAGILVWVGVVEMWAHDWMLGGEMTTAGPVRTALGMVALVAGMALMSLLGKWA